MRQRWCSCWGGWLLLGLVGLLGLGQPARAMMPELTDYRFNDGEIELAVKVPEGWQVAREADSLRMQRDPDQDIFGTAVLRFAEYAKAPSPDAFLDGALAAWGKQFDKWSVVERIAPPDRPRVRLASVTFRRLGFPCSGYVMAVIGQETGTIGFCYATTVAAAQLELQDFVAVLVAGTYDAFPVRAGGAPSDNGSQQAVDQVIQQLYGDSAADFQAVWAKMANDGQLDASMLSVRSRFQGALRQLKQGLANYLAERPKERVQDLSVYCVPAREFNAYAYGRNDAGPGFLAFNVPLIMAFASLAQEYTSLRNQGLSQADLGQRLTDYSSRLATAVIGNQEFPAPSPLDLTKDTNAQRFETVFTCMISLVMCHELAHYYLRHSESGETNEAFSVQQREVAADAAALAHLQRAADQTTSVWEGGAIHAFGFLATIDNIASAGGQQPEWTRSHPLGTTRLTMATATLGEDNFQFRNDPWNGGGQLEHGGGGVQVVGARLPDLGQPQPGGLPQPGGQPQGGPAPGGDPQIAFTHPQSQVDFTFPPGWQGAFDPTSNMLTIRRAGMDGMPLAMYSCGGNYPSAKAICDEVFTEIRGQSQQFQILKDEPLAVPNPQIKIHLAVGKSIVQGGELALICLGIQSPGWNHAMMLMTPGNRLDQDIADFETIFEQMRFVTQ